jgi:hypothetical protein
MSYARRELVAAYYATGFEDRTSPLVEFPSVEVDAEPQWPVPKFYRLVVCLPNFRPMTSQVATPSNDFFARSFTGVTTGSFSGVGSPGADPEPVIRVANRSAHTGVARACA